MIVTELINQLSAVQGLEVPVVVMYGNQKLMNIEVVNIKTENGKTEVILTNNEIYESTSKDKET